MKMHDLHPSLSLLLFNRFVSDHGFNGFKSVCQHKLLQAMHKAKYGPEGARGYPPSLLEWTGNKRKANIAIEVSCFDGEQRFSQFDGLTSFGQMLFMQQLKMGQHSVQLG